MKTTIELPDALVAEARQLARERHSTLRSLVESGLRAEMDRQLAGTSTRTFRFPTATGTGLQAGVDPQRLSEHAYDLSMEES